MRSGAKREFSDNTLKQFAKLYRENSNDFRKAAQTRIIGVSDRYPHFCVVPEIVGLDATGNIWAAGGWSPNHAMNGVRVFAPDGAPLGAIVLPGVAVNLCFGGHHHNRLFICASTSVYAMDAGTRGVEL